MLRYTSMGCSWVIPIISVPTVVDMVLPTAMRVTRHKRRTTMAKKKASAPKPPKRMSAKRAESIHNKANNQLKKRLSKQSASKGRGTTEHNRREIIKREAKKRG